MGGPDERRDPVDWSLIFDLIASEYSYTWDQFVSLTYKQLDSFLESIERRTHNKLVVRAALKGIKVELWKRHEPVSEKILENARSEIHKTLLEKQKKVSKNGKG